MSLFVLMSLQPYTPSGYPNVMETCAMVKTYMVKPRLNHPSFFDMGNKFP